MAVREALAAILRGPRAWAAFSVLAALTLIAAVAAGGEDLDRHLVQELAKEELTELAELGGFTGSAKPHPVTVVQDGGPLWVSEIVEAAIADEPAFEVGEGLSLLRVEILRAWGVVALQLHLWRQGWQLRGPRPAQVGNLPVLGAVFLLAGVAVTLGSRRLHWGLSIAGVGAQLALVVLPRPEVLVPRSLGEAWAQGPLARGVADLAGRLSEGGVAVASGIIVLCLLLIGFDHRRSRRTERDLGLGHAVGSALAGLVGSLAWLEASLRSGWAALPLVGWGWVCIGGSVAVLALGFARSRDLARLRTLQGTAEGAAS